MIKVSKPRTDSPPEFEAVDNFNAFWDERAWQEIERDEPQLNILIAGLVDGGFSPGQIKRLVLQRAPQRWPEARRVEQAARWIAGGFRE